MPSPQLLRFPPSGLDSHRKQTIRLLSSNLPADTQQTQHICITFVLRRPNVEDVGSALYKCYTNVLCFAG